MLFSQKKRNIKKFASNPAIKLNLGCGADHKKGWINIDSGEQFGASGLDVKHNLAKGIPFPDCTVDYIYHEHFIEHLTRPQGVKILGECHRVLKQNGVMRIACPDLKALIGDYLDDSFQDREWVQKIEKFRHKKRCELFNISLREWGHKYVYDFEDLAQALQEAGFKRDEVKEYGVSQSDDIHLSGLETRKDSLVIQARKR